MKEKMITEKEIRGLVEEKIEGTDKFIVDLKVHSGSKIVVFLDGDSSITIKDCIEVSRHIEGSLDREEEDFSLSVSTAGADLAFQNIRQYRKNIGRDVVVKLHEGKGFEGELVAVNEEDVVIMTRAKERIEGRKAKQWIETEHTLKYKDIMETKVVISFK